MRTTRFAALGLRAQGFRAFEFGTLTESLVTRRFHMKWSNSPPVDAGRMDHGPMSGCRFESPIATLPGLRPGSSRGKRTGNWPGGRWPQAEGGTGGDSQAACAPIGAATRQTGPTPMYIGGSPSRPAQPQGTPPNTRGGKLAKLPGGSITERQKRHRGRPIKWSQGRGTAAEPDETPTRSICLPPWGAGCQAATPRQFTQTAPIAKAHHSSAYSAKSPFSLGCGLCQTGRRAL